LSGEVPPSQSMPVSPSSIHRGSNPPGHGLQPAITIISTSTALDSPSTMNNLSPPKVQGSRESRPVTINATTLLAPESSQRNVKASSPVAARTEESPFSLSSGVIDAPGRDGLCFSPAGLNTGSCPPSQFASTPVGIFYQKC